MKLKKVLMAVFASVFIFSGGICLSSCSSANMTEEEASEKGYIKIPGKSSSFANKDYRDVYTQFKTAGFTNIRIIMMEDLITGWITDENTVDHVSVNGASSFKKSYVSPDSPVIIYVHSFSGATPDIPGYVEPKNADGTIVLGFTATSFAEQDKFNVRDIIAEKGFTNITFTPLQDLITGFLHNDGSVKEISVGGSTSYQKTDSFSSDEAINISYHCWEGDYCINGLEHSYVVDASVEATCTKEGLSEGKHCSVCNEIVTAQQSIPAKGHKETIDSAVPATCTHTGLTEGKHCSVCNEILVPQKDTPTDAESHVKKVDKAEQKATCVATGLTEESHCAECGVVLSVQKVTPVDLENHAELVTIAGEKATCISTGISDGMRCEACGKTTVSQEKTPIDPNNHANVVTDPAIKATSEADGRTEGCHCADCGRVIVPQKTSVWTPTAKWLLDNHTTTERLKSYCESYKGVRDEIVCLLYEWNLYSSYYSMKFRSCTTVGTTFYARAVDCDRVSNTSYLQRTNPKVRITIIPTGYDPDTLYINVLAFAFC